MHQDREERRFTLEQTKQESSQKQVQNQKEDMQIGAKEGWPKTWE
ncbi:MAG: hypothetical protein AAGC64_10795 [Bacteroidota bacterium]